MLAGEAVVAIWNGIEPEMRGQSTGHGWFNFLIRQGDSVIATISRRSLLNCWSEELIIRKAAVPWGLV